LSAAIPKFPSLKFDAQLSKEYDYSVLRRCPSGIASFAIDRLEVTHPPLQCCETLTALESLGLAVDRDLIAP
jgi:hypothetical protein